MAENSEPVASADLLHLSPEPSRPPENPGTLPTDQASLLSQIQDHRLGPSTTHSAPKLVDLLSDIPSENLACFASQGQDDILETHLSPELDGIPYFFILMARLETGRGRIDPLKLLCQAEKFSQSVPRHHLKVLSRRLLKFVRRLTNWASESGQLWRALDPITNLVKSHMPPDVLTTLHPQLMKTSLLSRSLAQALEISSHDILTVDQRSCPVTYQDHLIYHYLAGTIQALNKNYRRAIHLLTIVVSAPGPSISQFQIDAYKKLVLISLLSAGKSPALPRYTHPQFRTIFKNHGNGKLYNDLMSLYESADVESSTYEKLCQMVDQNMSRFEQDQNSGLVRLCMGNLPKKMIRNLGKVYESIPISRLKEYLPSLPPDSSEELIKKMISNQELQAEIDFERNALTFLPGEECEDGFLKEKLNHTIQMTQRTERRIKQILHQIDTDEEFLNKLTRDLKDSENGNSTSVGAADLTIGPEIVVASGSGGNSNANHLSGMMSMMIEEDLAGDMSLEWDEQLSFR